MLLVLVDEPVGALRRAERMIADFLVPVPGRVASRRLRGVVGAVIESPRIAGPRGAREFDPFDPIVRRRLVGGAQHADLRPIRTRFGEGVGAIGVVLGETHRPERHGPLRGEGVGIEKHLRLAAFDGLAEKDGLVLQSVVAKAIVEAAMTFGNSFFRIVPQFREASADRFAEGNPRKVVLRYGILGRDPRRRRLRRIVFEPAVGVRNLGAEIVVRRRAPLGRGVRPVFDALHSWLRPTRAPANPQTAGT